MEAKDLFIGIYSPNRFLVEFQVKKKNVPGSLARIAETLAKFNVNLCSGFLTAYPKEPEALFSFIADFTEVEVKPEEILKELKKLDVVIDAKLFYPKIKGLMVDEFHFPLKALGEKSLTFRVASVAKMFKELHDTFESGAKVILYRMGYSAGKSKIELVKKKYHLKGEEALSFILAERVAKGWCRTNILSFDKKVEIEVKDLFECPALKGSHFFRGYLDGVLEGILNREVKLKEEKCIAKGDEFCTFKWEET